MCMCIYVYIHILSLQRRLAQEVEVRAVAQDLRVNANKLGELPDSVRLLSSMTALHLDGNHLYGAPPFF